MVGLRKWAQIERAACLRGCGGRELGRASRGGGPYARIRERLRGAMSERHWP